MKRLVGWFKANVVLLGIILVGAILRFKIILRDDMWYDEAFTGNLMRVGKAEFWKILSQDPHPPLYNVFLKGWTSLFGVNDLSLRMPAAIFGIALIPVVYILVRKLFDKEITAAVAAFIIAVNPFLIDYSIEARSYSLYALLVALCVYFIVTRKPLLFMITMALAVLTHYMFAAYVPIIGLYYLWTVYRDKKNFLAAGIYLIPLAVLAVFIYMPALAKTGNLNIDWVKIPGISNIFNSITGYSFGVKSKLAGSDELTHLSFILDETVLGWGMAILYFTGVLAVIYKNRKDPEKLVNFLVTALSVIVPMILLIGYSILQHKNIYIERYLIPSCVFFVISLAYILNNLLTYDLVGVILFFYIYVLTTTVPAGYYTGMKTLVKNYAGYQGQIAFTSPIDYIVGEYYFNNLKTLKIYNPQNPENNWTWPFIYPGSSDIDMENAVFITPDLNRLPEGFIRAPGNPAFGNYMVYIKAPQPK